MLNTPQSFPNHGKQHTEEQPLDKIIKDATLKKLVDIFHSYGKSDAEIEDSLSKDLGLSKQRLKRFLKLESAEPSGHDGYCI